MEVREMHDLLPKTPLVGSVHLEYRRCGKTTCRCTRGRLHGPYPTLRWREDGRQRKALVKMVDLPRVLAQIEERRSAASASAIRSSLRKIGC
jgi:hypothetical protein